MYCTISATSKVMPQCRLANPATDCTAPSTLPVMTLWRASASEAISRPDGVVGRSV